MDEAHDVMRLKHYSIHTDRSYYEWIKRFIQFHKMTSRKDLKNGETKIEAFLTHLAVNKDVSASTQNQVMNALVILYKHVLKQPLDKEINAVRAVPPENYILSFVIKLIIESEKLCLKFLGRVSEPIIYRIKIYNLHINHLKLIKRIRLSRLPAYSCPHKKVM